MIVAKDSYGMPDIGASYSERGGKEAHLRAKGSRCPVCGRPWRAKPPMKGQMELMRTPMGTFVLRPPALSVCDRCGYGALARWAWDSEAGRGAWESGYLLSHLVRPHARMLFRFGHWELSLYDGRSLCPLPGDAR